ncbi:MAG: DUF839 domain-containing protein [Streptosporangiales bacterium]|nr:DUF839 domain-containing protein [Streptosporangiales bacterium]
MNGQPEKKLLPLVDSVPHYGRRSAMTCRYRCGNACSHPAPNKSGNEYFGDLVTEVVANRLSRRNVLRLSVAGTVAAGFAGSLGLPAAAAAPGTSRTVASGSALTFEPVPPNTDDAVTVADGYEHAVLVRWGEPILPGAPAFDPQNQSPAAQAMQFGYNNDFIGFLRLGGDDSALLAVNHEYTNEELMFPGWTSHDDATNQQKLIAMLAHGMAIVELERSGDTGEWQLVAPKQAKKYNRRIHARTPFKLTGPAAGSDLVKTNADPKGMVVFGMLNNCAGGVTPWGTVLSGEENFDQYFIGADGVPDDDKEALERYGLDTSVRYPDDNRKWDSVDKRFDLTEEPHEANRFGYIVEIDPYDSNARPVKHTALGRFKHEGANIRLAPNDRAVAYMGDDERFDYLYKFVSSGRMRSGDSKAAREHNKTLLTSGALYVARFAYTSADEIDGSGTLPSDGAFDGTGEWILLVDGDTSHVPGMSAAEVAVHTRLAADKVGATEMDRPEDVEPHPTTGKVYAALTNNSERGTEGNPEATEVAPRNENKHGQVLELTEANNDPTSTKFTWSLPLVCGDPADESSYYAGFDKTKVSPISCPDNVAFDPAGNLWISTDGNALEKNDGFFAVPLEGDERGYVKQLLTVPVGAETCGPWITDDARTAFIAVQHPGEVDGASFDEPASTWPDGDYARPAVINVWHTEGGRIGS